MVAFASLANPDYVNQRWHTSLICIATLGFSLMVNIYGVKLFPLLNFGIAAIGISTLLVVGGIAAERLTKPFT